jgi:hypothetical protein
MILTLLEAKSHPHLQTAKVALEIGAVLQSLYLMAGAVSDLTQVREMMFIAYIVAVVIEGAQVVLSFKPKEFTECLHEYYSALKALFLYLKGKVIPEKKDERVVKTKKKSVKNK